MNLKEKFKNLKRDKHPMPKFMKDEIEKHDLMEKYHNRPAYQQNDYVWWISSPKREETKQKRLAQMIKELKEGKKYMNMKYTGKI